MKVTIQTHTGNFLTATDGGGKSDPPGFGENTVPFHTNRTELSEFEEFRVTPAGRHRLALVTSSGQFVTAVNGGGMMDPPGLGHNLDALHTDATQARANEIFDMIPIEDKPGRFALKTTPGGYYVTAVNGGGMVDPPGQGFNTWPLHTDATRIQDWERFKITPVDKPLSNAQGHAHDAEELVALLPEFKTHYNDHMNAIKAAVRAKRMDTDTASHIKAVTQNSKLVKSALSRFLGSKTVVIAFDEEFSAGVGGSIAIGVAFDMAFEKYMFFDTMAGSLGFDVGASFNFRLGFFDFDVSQYAGWSVSAQVNLGAVLEVALQGVDNIGVGSGLELAFGAGIQEGVDAAVGYTSNAGSGSFP